MIDLVYVGFGVLAFVAYGAALRRRYRTWRRQRTGKAQRELFAVVALFLVASAAVVAIGLARLEVPIDARRLLGFIAWGGFAAAGLFVYDASDENA